MKIRLATEKDAEIIKNLINEMYGSNYETRCIDEIKACISNESEIYTLVENDNKTIGFCGIFITNDNNYKASIEYIYLPKNQRDLLSAYNCLMFTLQKLIDKSINSAKLQVQTYNKQRFLHYAITDKSIISEQQLETSKGEKYKDQILVIKDIKKLTTLPFSSLLKKVYYYKLIDK